MRADLLPTKQFAEAKAQLSDVMTEVVHHHHPLVVDRHRGKETMVLFGAEDLEPMLSYFRFATQTLHDDGEWTLRSPELELIAGGESFDEALDDLVSQAEAYAVTYFKRMDFYRQTDRAVHYPWLIRLAVTPADRRRGLFIEPPVDVRGQGAPARFAVA